MTSIFSFGVFTTALGVGWDLNLVSGDGAVALGAKKLGLSKSGGTPIYSLELSGVVLG